MIAARRASSYLDAHGSAMNNSTVSYHGTFTQSSAITTKVPMCRTVALKHHGLVPYLDSMVPIKSHTDTHQVYSFYTTVSVRDLWTLSSTSDRISEE